MFIAASKFSMNLASGILYPLLVGQGYTLSLLLVAKKVVAVRVLWLFRRRTCCYQIFDVAKKWLWSALLGFFQACFGCYRFQYIQYPSIHSMIPLRYLSLIVLRFVYLQIFVVCR